MAPTKEQIDRFFEKAAIYDKTPLAIANFEYTICIWENEIRGK